MKIVYVLLAIAVIAAIAFMFTSDDAVAPESENEATTEPSTEATPEPSTEAQDAPGEAQEADDTEAEVGSDVGMEYPTIENDAALEAGAEADGDTDATMTKEFTIDASNYAFSQTELRVNEGDRVTITLTNSEGFHDWVIDEFNSATDRIQAGETTSVTFVADEAGTYEYYCSVGNHRAQGMVGTLVVE